MISTSIALRYFNAAGADPDNEIGESHDPETHLIPLVLDAASGRRSDVTIFGTDYPTPDGTCVRDYIHVSDLADAHVKALQALERGSPSSCIQSWQWTGILRLRGGQCRGAHYWSEGSCSHRRAAAGRSCKAYQRCFEGSPRARLGAENCGTGSDYQHGLGLAPDVRCRSFHPPK